MFHAEKSTPYTVTKSTSRLVIDGVPVRRMYYGYFVHGPIHLNLGPDTGATKGQLCLTRPARSRQELMKKNSRRGHFGFNNEMLNLISCIDANKSVRSRGSGSYSHTFC